MTQDRIEKKVPLRAPQERVWQAISDSAQFGFWFGVTFDGPFVPGQLVTGRITPTRVDPEVAALQKPHEGKAFAFEVDRVEPMRLIAFRWHPYAIEPDIDYSTEAMTEIVFELEPAADGVLLTISESGFDRIPLDRRAKAFAANDAGWSHQVRLIAKYLEGR
jgi:uncharacterized protein YndB with AHSA1/START domain